MKVTTYVAGTAAITVAGRWAQEKPIDIRIAIGAAVYAVGLSIISNQDADIAQKLALAVLLTTMFLYVPAIVEKSGFTKPRPPEGK